MTFYGIATAIYAQNPSKMTTTVVAGDDKDTLRVESSETGNFFDPSKKYIERFFGNLGEKVQELLERPHEGKIVFINGTSAGYTSDKILKTFASSYGTIKMRSLSDEGLDEAGELIDSLVQSRGHRFSIKELATKTSFHPDVVEVIFRGAVASWAETLADKNQLFVAPSRPYTTIEDMCVGRTAGVVRMDKVIEEGPVGQEVLALLDRHDSGDESASLHNEIIGNAEALGILYGNFYNGQQEMTEMKMSTISRFFNASDDLRSRLYLVPGARKKYGDAFLATRCLDYNICVKGNRDRPSPPFADVVASLVADEMDAAHDTLPTTVMVQHA